jgi:predicted naringenin-chalcone synthase
MGLTILGIGTAVPKHGLTQARAAELASFVAGSTGRDAERLEQLYGLTGIRRRHIAALDEDGGVPEPFLVPGEGPTTAWRMARYEEAALPLGRDACIAALSEARLESRAVTHLVTVSCTGFSAPGLDLGLIRELRLDPTVERTNVGFMGCHGALNGLRVSRAIAAADPAVVVMLCAVEICSLHFTYGPGSERSVANALFADGAAAVVARAADEGDLRGRWSVESNGSVLIPDTADVMTWRVGDHGFQMTLAPNVPRLLRKHLRPWLDRWLEHHGLSVKGVGSWAVHPGGPKILDSAREALELPCDALDASGSVLAEYGNMSSPTLLFILQRLILGDAPRPCVAIGFGPGLTIEAALLR